MLSLSFIQILKNKGKNNTKDLGEMEINPLVLHARLRKIARPFQNLFERRVATTVWQIVLKIIPYDLRQSLKILL